MAKGKKKDKQQAANEETTDTLSQWTRIQSSAVDWTDMMSIANGVLVRNIYIGNIEGQQPISSMVFIPIKSKKKK